MMGAADPEVVEFGHVEAMYRGWLRQEIFRTRMFADAHLWPEPKGLKPRAREEAILAIGCLAYVFRAMRLS